MRDLASFVPFRSLEVENITLVVLCTANKENLRNFVTDLLGRDARSLHFLWQWVIKGSVFKFSVVVSAQDESLLDVQVIFKRKTDVLVFRQLDHILRQNRQPLHELASLSKIDELIWLVDLVVDDEPLVVMLVIIVIKVDLFRLDPIVK